MHKLFSASYCVIQTFTTTSVLYCFLSVQLSQFSTLSHVSTMVTVVVLLSSVALCLLLSPLKQQLLQLRVYLELRDIVWVILCFSQSAPSLSSIHLYFRHSAAGDMWCRRVDSFIFCVFDNLLIYLHVFFVLFFTPTFLQLPVDMTLWDTFPCCVLFLVHWNTCLPADLVFLVFSLPFEVGALYFHY